DESRLPGSLFMVGHDHHQMVAELSIPRPVISHQRRIEDLPVATMRQSFADIFGGRVRDHEIPRLGLEYLTEDDPADGGRMHFCVGQHFEFDRRPTHGFKGLNLSVDDTAGLWSLGDLSAYVLNDYLFEIPSAWSDQHLPGYRLITGRFRDGQWGGRGPAMVAYVPPRSGRSLPSGAVIDHVRPLVLYGESRPGQAELAVQGERQMERFSEADEWSGGSWLTSGTRSAVMLLGTKATGKTWYGFSNGVVYPISGDPVDTIPEVPNFPHDQRGWWSESIRAEAILFAPDDLADVASRRSAPWDPQPYARIDLSPYLFERQFEHPRQKRYLLGACAYDRDRRWLYVVERRVKADQERSLIHVFRIGHR
ncbi:MAG: hypothetical protein AAGA03_17570, partial [Planctomycetota bacterium]